MNRPQLLESDDARPFWDATRERRFVLPWCNSCGEAFWYPRAACPHCLSTDIDWRPAEGTGTVYAFSIQYNPALPAFADEVPYVVALVELTEGVRMMTNIVDCPPGDVSVGQAVVLAWEPAEDGRALPLFAPAPR